MQTIHKQELAISDIQTLELPRFARIVHIGLQRGVPCVWYMCDPNEPKMKMTIRCYGTGHPIGESGLSYIGTVLIPGDLLVLHYFIQNI